MFDFPSETPHTTFSQLFNHLSMTTECLADAALLIFFSSIQHTYGLAWRYMTVGIKSLVNDGSEISVL